MGDLLFHHNRVFVWTNNSCGGCIPNVRSCWRRKVSAFLEYEELLTFTVPIESCTLYTFRIVRCLLCRPTEDRVTKCSSHQAGSAVMAARGTVFLCWCYPAWCMLNYAFWVPFLSFSEVCMALYCICLWVFNSKQQEQHRTRVDCQMYWCTATFCEDQVNILILHFNWICFEWLNDYFLCFSMGNKRSLCLCRILL